MRERDKEREENIKTEKTEEITEDRERLIAETYQNLPISVSLMTNLVLTNFLE